MRLHFTLLLILVSAVSAQQIDLPPSAPSIGRSQFVTNDSASRQRLAHNELASILTRVVLEDSAGGTLDSAVVERVFIAPDVQQSAVTDNGLRALFFTPERTSKGSRCSRVESADVRTLSSSTPSIVFSSSRSPA